MPDGFASAALLQLLERATVALERLAETASAHSTGASAPQLRRYWVRLHRPHYEPAALVVEAHSAADAGTMATIAMARLSFSEATVDFVRPALDTDCVACCCESFYGQNNWNTCPRCNRDVEAQLRVMRGTDPRGWSW